MAKVSKMHKQAPNVEWHVAESDAEWEHLRAQPLLGKSPATSRSWQHKCTLWGLAALLLLVVSVVGNWWRSLQMRSQQTATAAQALDPMPFVPAALVTNSLSNQSSLNAWYELARKASSLQSAIQNDASVAHLDIPLQAFTVQGNHAVARVVQYTDYSASGYRQTRFYERTAGGWRPMSPDAALWGAERSLVTPYFVYHFRQNDAEVVTAVAPQIDALYATIQDSFGLPLIVNKEKRAINVNVTLPTGNVLSWTGGPVCLCVPSPALYWAPVELSDAKLLEQSILLPLLTDIKMQASAHYAIGESWQSMLDALFLWQIWNLDLPLANWRTDVVQWLYRDLPTSRLGQPVVLPKRYTALCASHQLWLVAPAQIGIPLVCTEREPEEWMFVHPGSRTAPDRLNQLAVPERSMQVAIQPPGPDPRSYAGQTVVLATLIEYAVTTYGGERLPTLVAGLGQYDRWETLLPAVYSVSPVEFEAGWQAYLMTHYGVDPATIRQ